MRTLAAALIFAAFSVVPMASTALAQGNYATGLAAYKQKKFATALDIIRPLAEAGDPRAQKMLGDMYSLGRAIDEDNCEATRWYDRAARSGNASAQYQLARAYFMKIGIAQDHELAYRWGLTAIRNGDRRAEEDIDLLASGLFLSQKRTIELTIGFWNLAAQKPARIIRLPDIPFVSKYILDFFDLPPCRPE